MDVPAFMAPAADNLTEAERELLLLGLAEWTLLEHPGLDGSLDIRDRLEQVRALV